MHMIGYELDKENLTVKLHFEDTGDMLIFLHSMSKVLDERLERMR